MSHWGLINRLAKRRFASESLAEEAALFVVNGLEKDNWQRLKRFREKSSFQTFLSSLTFRLLEDFSRKKFGRIRPPLWLRKLGGIWLLLYTFLCRERLKTPEAIESVSDCMPSATHKEIEEAAWTILEKVTDCGTHQAREVAFDDTLATENTKIGNSVPQEKLEEEEKTIFFTALFNGFLDSQVDPKVLHSAEKILRTGISLQPEERLLLKMCYRDGLSVTEAGRILGFNRHQIHGRMRRLLARLRTDFEKIGIDRELKLLVKR